MLLAFTQPTIMTSQQRQNKRRNKLREQPLTSLELKIIQLIAMDYQYKQIAVLMNMKIKTIDNYLSEINYKLGFRGKAMLTRMALKLKLVDAFD